MSHEIAARSQGLLYHVMESPLGPILLRSDGVALTGLDFIGSRDLPVLRPDPGQIAHAAYFAAAVEQLQEYFAGTRSRFDLPLAPHGTPFARRVWALLTEIPYGATWSYGEVAARVGNPHAARAVGRVVGRNPLSLVIPCHRVVGADGALVGYGGGLDRKAWLLNHERVHAPQA